MPRIACLYRLIAPLTAILMEWMPLPTSSNVPRW